MCIACLHLALVYLLAYLTSFGGALLVNLIEQVFSRQPFTWSTTLNKYVLYMLCVPFSLLFPGPFLLPWFLFRLVSKQPLEMLSV